jgi:erythromycin esterase
MRKELFVLAFLIISSISYSQIENNLYQLNSTENLLTKEVKGIISKNIDDKRVIFLGESEHHIGSDFLAKTQFVKYLVKEKGYKDIVFESDFFGLYFDHRKYNIFPYWSISVQCQELFKFLEENEITIWGFDNQTHSYYTYHNFVNKLETFMKENEIVYRDDFLILVDKIIKNGYSSKKEITDEEVNFLLAELDKYLLNYKVKSNQLWKQILESFKTTVQIYTINSGNKEGIPIRDKQMAKNLSFLVNNFSNRKFIVWLANAHMAKYEYEFMEGETMGSDFNRLNPNISYHIAISSINMPYRKEKFIEKSHKDNNNLLHFLPSTNQNYFIDSKQLLIDKNEFENKEFEGMFGLNKTTTNWFKHFDALVFIGIGETSVIINNK